MTYFLLYELFPFVWDIFFSTQDVVPGQEVKTSDQGGISRDGGEAWIPSKVNYKNA